MIPVSQITHANAGLKTHNKTIKPSLKTIQKVGNSVTPKVRNGSKIAFKFLEHFAKGLELMFKAIHIK